MDRFESQNRREIAEGVEHLIRVFDYSPRQIREYVEECIADTIDVFTHLKGYDE